MVVPADADATTGTRVALSVGSNVITVRVTAADGTTEQDYTVTVMRDAAPSSDATLSDLTLSGVTLDQMFASGTMAYTASVGNEVDQTTVDARQTHSSASVDISPADADAGNGRPPGRPRRRQQCNHHNGDGRKRRRAGIHGDH